VMLFSVQKSKCPLGRSWFETGLLLKKKLLGKDAIGILIASLTAAGVQSPTWPWCTICKRKEYNEDPKISQHYCLPSILIKDSLGLLHSSEFYMKNSENIWCELGLHLNLGAGRVVDRSLHHI
jgi:hypothetical protein